MFHDRSAFALYYSESCYRMSPMRPSLMFFFIDFSFNYVFVLLKISKEAFETSFAIR